MLEHNIIETAQTEWTSPIVFAPREIASYNFVKTTYSKLNVLTKRDSYSATPMNDCND